MAFTYHYNNPQIKDLIDVLEFQAENKRDTVLYRFLSDDGSSSQLISYAELAAKAKAIAVQLAEKASIGERVLLIYQPGLDLIAAYFGCLYAGLVAVPVYPPFNTKLVEKLQRIVLDSDPSLVLSSTKITQKIQQLKICKYLTKIPGGRYLSKRFWPSINKLLDWEFEKLPWITTDKIGLKNLHQWQKPAITPDQLAFLQYTSGSTDWPKGVMISHRNLLHNLQLIVQGFELSADDRCVSWLPPYHDMGLIGSILLPLYVGMESTLFSPMSFLQHPFLWLKTISDYKGTLSGAPNFAYDFCVRKITDQELASLDLSHWAIAFNGAEPIHPHSLERFSQRFQACGFNKNSFFPCYGLAEGTLFVSGVKRGQGYQAIDYSDAQLKRHQARKVDDSAVDKKTLVNCGNCLQKIYIVNPETQEICPEGEVGEIWISSPSVAQGYWGNVAATCETFYAKLPEDPDHYYLRSGDLGFIQANQLFVTGRLKDLIIIHGINHYPQDIEYTLSHAHHHIRQGNCAAFSLLIDNEEHLAVICEVEPQADKTVYAKIAVEVRKIIAQHHELATHTIALIKAKSLPKTTSGKIRRRYSRNLLFNEGLELLYLWTVDNSKTIAINERREQELNPTENQLIKIYREIFEQENIGVKDNFFNLGGDSLSAMQLVAKIRDHWHIEIEGEVFFEDPSVGQMAYLIDRQLEQVKVNPGNHLLIPRYSRAEIIPLSFSQQRLWFLDQLYPEQAFYNLAAIIEMNGKLNNIALHQALADIVQRHEILRTVFPQYEGQASQHILPNPNLTIREQYYENDQEKQAIIHRETMTAFDLSIGPLLRVGLLVTREKNQHTLLIVLHHIIADGWSLAIFAQELSQLYNAYAQQRSVVLPALTIQYADYSQWQHTNQQAIINQQLAFWKEALKDAPTLLALATDKPRPAIASYQGESIYSTLSPTIVQQLKVVAQEQGCTLYMVMLTIFQIFLYRYTQQTDMVIGSVAANRSQTEIEKLVGFFANTLALRLKITADNVDFVTQLKQTKQVVLSALANQAVPFEQIVHELALPRNLSMNPLIQVMFALQSNKAILELSGLQTAVHTYSPMAKFDLTLECSEEEQGMTCRWEYSSDLFLPETIATMAKHFSILLENLVEQPQQSVQKVAMLTSEDMEKFQQWNATAVSMPMQETIPHLFEMQVGKNPQCLALFADSIGLTYQELNERSNQLAHCLLEKHHVQQEELVALCLDRNAEMVVAILAVLKVGAAYVPIDPDNPAEHIHYILQDTEAKVLLTNLRHRPKLAKNELTIALEYLDETDFQKQLTSYPKKNLRLSINSHHLAYVIYTSGTTGQPKGVMIEHRNVINFINGLGFSHDRPLHATFTSPYMFDVSTFDLWSNLCFGHSLFIVTNEVLTSPQKLDQFIKLHAINKIYLPASLLEIHKEVLRMNNSVTQILTGVEPLSQASLEQLSGVRQIINGYGPTECTTCATLYDVEKEGLQQPSRLIPIGRPMANTKTYVLDMHLNYLPIGAIGELYIGGEGLARGYLHHADLTCEHFIANPFQTAEEKLLGSNAYLYKTGDLVRYLPDGNLEFIGRNDLQVKVRGFRVELGEIENKLRSYPGIKQAAVLVKKQQTGQSLLAYYVAIDQIDSQELLAYLQEQLPAYMVPNLLIAMPELPLTPNGKLDRQMLPTSNQQSRSHVPASNPVQEKLLAIWSQALNVSDIGINDNFFELGGHSLIAIQVLQKISQSFDRTFPLSSLFTHPTIEAFSQLCAEETISAHDNVLLPLKPTGSRPPLFIVHPAGGHLLAYHSLSQNMPADQPLYGLQQLAKAESIETMARDYITAIRKIQKRGPYHLLGWSMGGVIVHEMAHQLEQQGEELALLGLIDSYYSTKNDQLPELQKTSILDPDVLRLISLDFWRSRGRDCALEEVPGRNLMEQLGVLLQAAKMDQLVGPDTTAEQLFEGIQLWYENIRLLHSYKPKVIKSDILAFRAARPGVFAQQEGYLNDWQQFSRGEVTLQDLAGDHYTLLQMPGVVNLVQLLENNIQEGTVDLVA